MNKRDVANYSFHLEDNIFALHDALRNGSYRHDRYQSFYVHDPKRRHISKASVRDRIVHQALVQVIEPLFERRFIHDSYASRVGKGTHAAVERLEQFLRQATSNYHRPVFALKCDIRKFFDSIRHDVLLSLIEKTIIDERLRNLIREIVGSYAYNKEGTRGLPLGNVSSQLFANIYLDQLDHFIKDRLRMRWYLRFCDDFIILHWDRTKLAQVLDKVGEFLLIKLDLNLHPNKVVVRKLSEGVDFVGQVSLPHHRILRPKTIRRLFRKTEKRAQEYRQEEISEDAFRSSMQSSLGIFMHGSNQKKRRLLRESIARNLGIV